MALKHPEFANILRSAHFTQKISHMVIDEAHCILNWGAKFRPLYADLGRLRTFFGLATPVVLSSATMGQPEVRESICRTMGIHRDRSFQVNLGNDRPNLCTLIQKLNGAPTDLSVLDFLVQNARPGAQLPRALIFVNKRWTAQQVAQHLRDRVPEELHTQINFVHSLRDEDGKTEIMQHFRTGLVNILVATECAGMGVDISDIDFVIQFLLPDSLTTLIQRLGRAGRGGQPAIVILLVEDSAYQEVKRRNDPEGGDTSDGADDDPPGKTDTDREEEEEEEEEEDEDEEEEEEEEDEGRETMLNNDVEEGEGGEDGGDATAVVKTFRKNNIAVDLRHYLDTTGCLRLIVDKVFDNPPPLPTGRNLSVPCCHNCIRASCDSPPTNLPDLISFIHSKAPLKRTLLDPVYDIDDLLQSEPQKSTLLADVDAVAANAQKKTRKPNGQGDRRGAHRTHVLEVILEWRYDTWENIYVDSGFAPEAFLPDQLAAVLASKRFPTVEKLRAHLASLTTSWPLFDKHAANLLEVLSQVDSDEAKERNAMNKSRKREREATAPARAPAKRRRTKNTSPAPSAASTSTAASSSLNSGLVSNLHKGSNLIDVVFGGVLGHLMLDHKSQVYGFYVHSTGQFFPGPPPHSWRIQDQWYDFTMYSTLSRADLPRHQSLRSRWLRLPHQVSAPLLSPLLNLTSPSSGPPGFAAWCVSSGRARDILC
jgi:superfamily II DNA/RNA helicase